MKSANSTLAAHPDGHPAYTRNSTTSGDATRSFRNFLGQTPARYYLTLRLERAREMLLYTEQPIIEIAIATGFASTSHFSRWVKEIYGIRPTQLRAQRRRDRAPQRNDTQGA